VYVFFLSNPRTNFKCAHLDGRYQTFSGADHGNEVHHDRRPLGRHGIDFARESRRVRIGKQGASFQRTLHRIEALARPPRRARLDVSFDLILVRVLIGTAIHLRPRGNHVRGAQIEGTEEEMRVEVIVEYEVIRIMCLRRQRRRVQRKAQTGKAAGRGKRIVRDRRQTCRVGNPLVGPRPGSERIDGLLW
jgi:hypothetical protein